MMWSAKPGMQVVCITDIEPFNGFARPQRGCVYAIRDVMVSSWPGREGEIGIKLEEIHNPPWIATGRELWFAALCFRPCAPTDIGALQALLAPRPARGRKVEVVE